MTISFSGLASGLDTSSWVEALVEAKKSEVTALETKLTAIQTKKATLNKVRSASSTLRSAVEKLTDAKFGGTFDLFSKNTATSSNTDVFTATASSGAIRQNYDLSVQQLATYTKATSKESASAVADGETKLSALGITKGSLTFYVDGKKETINIEDDDTIANFKSQLAEVGIKANIDEDGILKFSTYDEEKSLHIGATTDTSNFISLTGLEIQEDGTYSSANALYKVGTSSTLTDINAGFRDVIKEGTFKIGNATFTINDQTTLSSLIAQINENKDAQAYAYWDDATGKMVINSTKEGASYINIEAGTSNFTDVMGFTQSEYDEAGNITSSIMFTDAQELGQNALFTLNGTSITSTSNTVTSDISRIAGVTITLNRANTEDDEPTTLKVGQDTKELEDALEQFVTSYNDLFATINETTASGADLHGESSLTSMKNAIRSYATGNNANGGVYNLLSEVGITTSAADSSNLATDTYELKFDKEKFLEALDKNPDSVKAILAGDNGIFSRIEATLEQSLKATSGYFDIKTSTLDSDITKMETKINKKNSNVSAYQTQLENQFYKMELAIAQMQQNYSSFLQ